MPAPRWKTRPTCWRGISAGRSWWNTRSKAARSGCCKPSGIAAAFPKARLRRSLELNQEIPQALQENPSLDGIILLKAFITPEDSPDLINARSVLESFGKHVAVLTSRGGVTSHAAVVANMEKIPAIVGAEELDLRDESGETVAIFRQDHAPQHQVLRKLEALTLDLDSGKVYDGALPPCDPSWVGSNPPS